MSLIVKAKVKEYAKNKKGEQMNVAGDFAETLSKQAEEMIQKACERAENNGRRTVQGRDL